MSEHFHFHRLKIGLSRQGQEIQPTMDGHQTGSSQTGIIFFLNDKIIFTQKKKMYFLSMCSLISWHPFLQMGPQIPASWFQNSFSVEMGVWCCLLKVLNLKGVLLRILFKDFVLLHLFTQKRDCPCTEHPHCCANIEKNFGVIFCLCIAQINSLWWSEYFSHSKSFQMRVEHHNKMKIMWELGLAPS